MESPRVTDTSNVRSTCDMVGSAAQLFDISEYRLFEAAHQKWFGRPLPEKCMKALFSDYLRHGRVPYWVAHIARTAMNRAESGMLEPEEFGIEQPAPLDEDAKALGAFYLSLMGMGMWMFIALLVYGFPSA